MYILPSLFLASAAAPVSAQPTNCVGNAGTGKIKLTLVATDVRNTKGEVAFTIYPDDRKRFLAKGGKLLRARVPSRAPETSACFWVKPGHYAVATYHDENGDRDFNRTLFKVKEGYGFSNDAPTTLGLPSFKSARFAAPVDGGSVRIRTRYP